MKLTVKTLTEAEVKTLHVVAGARYWEDATVNGVEDENGDLIPCRDGDYWKPIIDIETGVITNWKQGITASIHYKVCDDGSYYLKDAEGKTIKCIEQDYVPKIMCPGGSGYGDYIIMEVDADGKIENWQADISDDFEKD